ncbi:Hypothetical predicted protein [Octopus vulgaris]|uniref:Myotubularin phosphatase domain-containing protein n=1 Tax=Octopus vulgaris TaxID=6645 RepID=A0AA36BRN6_OCTVU|nr:Hypothetical predicted protein [Octopus vulgaris]
MVQTRCNEPRNINVDYLFKLIIQRISHIDLSAAISCFSVDRSCKTRESFIKPTPKVPSWGYLFSSEPSDGPLIYYRYHKGIPQQQESKSELWLLHRSIDSVEKKLSGAGGTLTIRCKDFSIIQLEIPLAEECINIASSVEQLSNIDDVALMYPFFYRPLFDVLEDGWQAFLPQEEFNRFKECSDEWRLSYINKDYEVCPSYPHLVIVPKSIDDITLVRVAGFRQHGRFPVLCYYHKDTKAVMMRSSQPLTGTNGRRCKDDERLVNAVLGIGRRGYILDTRSQGHAKAAQAKGGGFEPEAHYSQWRRINQAIDRKHALHDSIIKLIEACNDTSTSTDKWLSKLDSSGWLSNVKDVINAACMVAQFIDKEAASVLVHGSDGLDTTLQVTSLAQLLLDHDCRTVRGFEALVEREWLQAGHPFQERCAKSAFAMTKQHKEAPVFLLFLDCVWQIWQQFPCSFEFNEDFLLLLFQHAYASQFGTFLCNNEFERKNHELVTKTVSLWSYVNRPEVIQTYMNPMYEPNQGALWPSVAPQSLQLWTALYCSSIIDNGPRIEGWDEMAHIQESDKELRSRVNRLRRQVECLLRQDSKHNKDFQETSCTNPAIKLQRKPSRVVVLNPKIDFQETSCTNPAIKLQRKPSRVVVLNPKIDFQETSCTNPAIKLQRKPSRVVVLNPKIDFQETSCTNPAIKLQRKPSRVVVLNPKIDFQETSCTNPAIKLQRKPSRVVVLNPKIDFQETSCTNPAIKLQRKPSRVVVLNPKIDFQETSCTNPAIKLQRKPSRVVVLNPKIVCIYKGVAKSYKIFQNEPVELGQSVLLSTEEIPNLRTPFHWSCGNRRYECDKTCLDHKDFKVTNRGNSSTFWIRSVTKECLKWKFNVEPRTLMAETLGTIEIQLKTTTTTTTTDTTTAAAAATTTSGYPLGTSLCIAVLIAIIL